MADVDEAKVRDYLLSQSHAVGHAKARFFTALGFSHQRWEELRDTLLEIARTGHASRGMTSVFGQKYYVRSTIRGPSGRVAVVVTVWIVRREENLPRFVTAYPGYRK
jgi:hypothetical protein